MSSRTTIIKLENLSEPSEFVQELKIENIASSEIKTEISGPWTSQENLKYAVFVDVHKNIFASKERRKSSKIYTYLSKFLRTRSAQQCRSHFQKIMIRHKQSLPAFISSLKKIFGKEAYGEAFQNCPIAKQAFRSLQIYCEKPQETKQKQIKDQSTQTEEYQYPQNYFYAFNWPMPQIEYNHCSFLPMQSANNNFFLE